MLCSIVAVLVVVNVYTAVVNSEFAPKEYGLCSQVYQMHEYCFGPGNNEPTTVRVQGRTGKAGPQGPPGRPGVVDHNFIDSKITGKFAELETNNNEKLKECQSRLDVLEKKVHAFEVTDCSKASNDKGETGGIFNIYSFGFEKLEVSCDLVTDGGGWMVFQRRMDGSVDFYRNWNDYVHGFGNKSGEYWLGLKALHRLTSLGDYELRIDLQDWDGNRKFAKYSSFVVGNAESGYKLTLGEYSGDAGNSMSDANGKRFTTKDRDLDERSSDNCAVLYKGGWWYRSCHHANLNGFYFVGGTHESFADGIEWNSWKGYNYSLKFVEMKIRLLR